MTLDPDTIRKGAGRPDTLTDVPSLQVGHARVPGGGSGCTVILGPFRARVEVPGPASGTRELEALRAEHVTPRVDALLLSGGSAFGLAAADGVMAWLAENGRGYKTAGGAVVPIVPTAILNDLREDRARPGSREGRSACAAAGADPVPQGAVGAGTGARVGKLLGLERAVAGGLGSASRRVGPWTVGALAVVNALGDVVDPDGRVVAGPTPPGTSGTRGVLEGHPPSEAALQPGENTTLCLVATDAPLGTVDLGRFLRMAATALPRRISPAHTPFDGDVVFAVSTAEDEDGLPRGEFMALGLAATDTLERAILRAVGAGEGT